MKHKICLWLLFLGLYLGISNGNLAIFRDGQTVPLMVLPYKAEKYPEKDQQLLKEGIHFSTNDELAQLLEDYMS